MRRINTPIYSALFFFTLLAIIAGASAFHVLAGEGDRIVIFALGVAVGMGWSCYVGIENWKASMKQLDRLERWLKTDFQSFISTTILPTSPRLALDIFAQAQQKARRNTSADLSKEIEIRRLLDAVNWLIQGAIEDGHCRYCGSQKASSSSAEGHEEDCKYGFIQRLYSEGRSVRTPWKEFSKAHHL